MQLQAESFYSLKQENIRLMVDIIMMKMLIHFGNRELLPDIIYELITRYFEQEAKQTS